MLLHCCAREGQVRNSHGHRVRINSRAQEDRESGTGAVNTRSGISEVRLKQTCLLSWKGYAKRHQNKSCMWRHFLLGVIVCNRNQNGTTSSTQSASTLCFSNKELEESGNKRYGETNREKGRASWRGEPKWVWMALVVEFLEVFWQFVSLLWDPCEAFSPEWSKLEAEQGVASLLDVCQPHSCCTGVEEAKKIKNLKNLKNKSKKMAAEESDKNF